MKIPVLRSIRAVVLFSMALLCFAATGFSAGPAGEQKVLILPPTLNGSPDMAYLRQGLVDMLTTRLARPGKVMVVPVPADMDVSGKIDRTRALETAVRVGVDHVVYGSMTILGSNISTDLQIADVAAGHTLVAFSRSGKDPSALIEHADLFVAEADARVYGLGAKQAVKAVPQPAPSGDAGQPEGSIYQHPEKLLEQPIGLEEDSMGRSGAMMIGAASAIRGPRIVGQVQSVTLGDFDGDGITDAAMVGKGQVWIYKFTNGRFAKMATIQGTGDYVGVDALDVNANGKDELFVTNFDSSSARVISFVLEHDGRAFKRTQELMNYYFRAMNVPMRGRVLFGQRQGLEGLFQPGIYEMVWEGGKYRRGTRLKTPRGQNIFGMALGTLPPSPEPMIIAYNASTQIEITDNTGKQEWNSADGYGIGAALLKSPTKEDLSNFDYHYLPTRIESIDIDQDGDNEAVVLKNTDASGSIVSRTRLFKQGRLEILQADALGMGIIMRTRSLPKFISDFAIGDMNGDGKPEILTAVVQKTSNILEKGRTNIYLFKLDALLAGKKDAN